MRMEEPKDDATTYTAEVLNQEPLGTESRVSRPMDGKMRVTHLAPKQDGMRQGLAPRKTFLIQCPRRT